ncbi:MAG: efflux RND transporter periplasmic adaptor subunit [Lachnospiraceae bacterium]
MKNLLKINRKNLHIRLPKKSDIKNIWNLAKQKKNRKWVLLAIFVFAVLVISILWFAMRTKRTAAQGAESQQTASVTRGSITSELSSSGTISPKNTYTITSLVEGEVIAADFEEGDEVEEGQILYQIDVSSMETELKSANNSLERAQNTYDLAVEDYNEAVELYSDNSYKSTETGYIKTLYIEAGDKVTGNTKIADIYNDRSMKIKVPFLSSEAAAIGVGNNAIVTLSDTQEQLPGVVTAVSNMEETLTGGRLIRYVTVQVTNPGGLTTDHTALVTIGDFTSSQEGSFVPITETVMSADLTTDVEVGSMLVAEGDFVNVGTGVFRMTDKTAENLIRTYQDTMDKAEESLESAQSKAESTQDSYENYTITAPISGTVITKSVKVGDNVSKGSSSGSTELAVIYDLSSVTFEMSVDELDVQEVEVGQKVEISADAVEGKTFTGTVTNVSLQSTYSNGVTNYPVTVTLDEVGELLPGMNVDGTIILDEAEDVLMVPVGALMRGNKVYVKDDSVKEADGVVPAGFRAVDVETGVTSDEYVEIISGLSEGDQVYVSPDSGSQDSMSPMMNFNMGGGPGGGGGQGGPGGGGAPSGMR